MWIVVQPVGGSVCWYVLRACACCEQNAVRRAAFPTGIARAEDIVDQARERGQESEHLDRGLVAGPQEERTRLRRRL